MVKMTNAEKYLKVSVNEFFKAIINSKIDISGLYSLEKWLFEEAKPTLTEDERVILRNIQQEWKTIFRGSLGTLELHNEKGGWSAFYPMSHLFQFIKERRRISN